MNKLGLTNIPTYRAKKRDSDEWVEGFLTCEIYKKHEEYFIIKPPSKMNDLLASYDMVDPTTLAIHFPSMLDKKDKKIFASLSEDGKGGDRLKITVDGTEIFGGGTYSFSASTYFNEQGFHFLNAGWSDGKRRRTQLSYVSVQIVEILD